MQELTPWLLLVVSAVGVVVWWIFRRFVNEMKSVSLQLASLAGLQTMPNTIKNLESLVKDELRHFDVRITRLEARSEMRGEKP
jgi:hypothetical protein